jgi:hypothetical protein
VQKILAEIKAIWGMASGLPSGNETLKSIFNENNNKSTGTPGINP